MSNVVPLYGFGGGGGAALNFSVVGNPQPASPKENTIWVNTDVKITGYVFSAVEPADPVEGMVWISVGVSSSAPFNALKKNNITVYPMSAKQYVSGAWVDKTAKSYQGGAWVDWFTYIHSVTNGYNAELFGSYSTPVLGSGGDAFTVDKSGIYTANGYPILSNFIINNPIDLTPYSYAEFEVKGGVSTDMGASVGFTATNKTDDNSLKPTAWGNFAWSGGFDIWTKVRIDLTNANAKMYFRIGQWNCRDGFYVRNIVLV